MTNLVQADGDFDLVADIIEGLEKLPPDYVPELSESSDFPFHAVIVVQRSEAEPEECGIVGFGVNDLQGVKEKRRWFESRGYPVVLWTPPLPPDEAERYLAALYGHTTETPWKGIVLNANEDLLQTWGWIN